MANDALFTDPWAVNLDTARGIGLSAVDSRHNISALALPASGNTYGVASGVFPGGRTDAGIPNDLKVTTASFGMAINVGAGTYVVARGGNLGAYLGALIGTYGTFIPASNPSSPRIDYVVLRIREPITDGQPNQSAAVVVLSGIPASGPVPPDNQLTDGDLILAQVLVRAGAVTIAAGDITDKRQFVNARGGIRLAVPGDTRPGAYEGEYRDNLEYNQLERWSGTEWQAVATPAEWLTQTPRLIATGTGTDIGMGTGAGVMRVVRFQLVGKRLDFNFYFQWGTGPWNGGFGDVYTQLPKHPVTGQQMVGALHPQWVSCQLMTGAAAGYEGFFSGIAKIHENSNKVQPWFMIHSRDNSNLLPYKIANANNVRNSGVPRIYSPDGFPHGGNLNISGSCEVKFV